MEPELLELVLALLSARQHPRKQCGASSLRPGSPESVPALIQNLLFPRQQAKRIFKKERGKKSPRQMKYVLLRCDSKDQGGSGLNGIRRYFRISVKHATRFLCKQAMQRQGSLYPCKPTTQSSATANAIAARFLLLQRPSKLPL